MIIFKNFYFNLVVLIHVSGQTTFFENVLFTKRQNFEFF